MNIKDLLTTFVFALLAAWGIQYFVLSRWTSGNQTVAGAPSFVAPESSQVAKPLNIEIDFVDAKRTKAATHTTLQTKWAEIQFSTDGASLDRLAFKRTINDKQELLGTIFPSNDTEREERCFLVALQEETPFYYNLINKTEDDAAITVIYQASTNKVIIEKTFVVHKDEHQIDLTLDITPKIPGIEARIFYTSPYLPGIEKDVISSVVIDGAGNFEKIAQASLPIQKGWFSPSVFGTDSRYFIHAMTNDHNKFVQRAYYKFAEKKLFPILEGPSIDTKTSWTMSFFFGPKELSAIAPVDTRLEKTLDYSGILAPISKLLLSILNGIYRYVPNYGLAIILLTLLIKLLLLPFSIRGERKMKGQNEMRKKLAYIEQKYKHDKEMLMRERAELIKKHGMPGLGGCLPILMQIPIFFALSRVLSGSVELYKQPMLWIPNLSAPDPYYIFPALVMIGMLAQAMFADKQQRMSLIAMALIFGAVTASLSSGLALYISVSTLLGVLQTRLLKYLKIVQ